jgi:hypothetical protein
MIIAGALQDPIRKITPGTPGYLVLSTVPIFLSMIVGGLMRNIRFWSWFRRDFKPLSKTIRLFMISLVPGAVISLTYGLGGMQLILMGILSYGVFIMGWLAGFGINRNYGEMRKILSFYCIATSVMLIGTPLEYFKLFPDSLLIGTKALEMDWIRYTGGDVIKLIAGFYRSPDVMGWHAVAAGILATVLAMTSRGGRRYAWVAVAAWCLAAAMLCGRRKMVLMFPVFCIVLIWLYLRMRHSGRAIKALGLVAVVIIAGFTFYDFFGSNEARETYYFRQMGQIPERAKAHGIDSVIGTYRQSGFFGEGLGMAATGAHHLDIERPHIWQEGGLDRLMVELGVPGLICFIILVVVMARTILKLVRTHPNPKSEEFIFTAGLSSFFFANAGSFIVSHQIFGDPYILTFFSLLIGFILSAARTQYPSSGFVPSLKGLQTEHGQIPSWQKGIPIQKRRI